MRNRCPVLFLLFLSLAACPGAASAACGSLGSCSTAGQRDWDSSLKTLKYCNGADWINMGALEASTLADGLAGHWKLDDGTGSTIAADSSGNGNDGALTNMEAGSDWGTGIDGGALDFDGADDYVEVADNAALSITGALTIAGWYRYDGKGATDWGRIFGKAWNAAEAPWSAYNIQLDDSAEGAQKVFFNANQSAVTQCSTPYSSIVLTVGTWYHLAGVFDPGNRCALYIDGGIDVESATSMTAVADTTGAFRIASDAQTGQISKGRIDDVRVYDRALSAAEITELYLTTQPIDLVNGLAGHWTFDESPGSTSAADSSGNGNDGALTNMDINNDWVGGQINGALDFAGDDDYVRVTHDFNSADVTVAFWMNYGGSTGWAVNKFGSTSNAWGVRVLPGPDVGLYEDIGGGDVEIYRTAVGNGWHHVAAMIDNEEQKLYVDGVLAGSGTNTAPAGSTLASFIGDFYIGARRTSSDYLAATIDDVRIYDRALSAVGVYALYDSGSAGQEPCAGITESKLEHDTSLGNYKFCDGRDWIPVANNGTVGACSGNPAQEYDGSLNIWKWCGGADWIDMSNLGSLADSSLVGHWTFDDGAGSTTAADASGNGNDGALTNMDPNTAWVATGKIGGALDFDGTDDHVEIADEGVGGVLDVTGSLTIAAWVKPEAPPASQQAQIVIKWRGSGATDSPYSVRMDDMTGWHARFFASANDTTRTSMTASSPTLQEGQWYHIVAVHDDAADEVSLYVDGVLRDGPDPHVGGIYDSDGPLRIGLRNGTTMPFPGLIDDVRIYNRALSPEEIDALYNGGAGCP